MRIIAGNMRGTKLASVGKGDTGAHLRPTTDRVRENLFNMLTSGAYDDPITGARVLDLFAGTGALGFEALSRGAAHVSFVDNGKTANDLLRANIDLTRTNAETHIFRRDAARLGDWQGAPFDLIFLDPPYGMGLGGNALNAALKGGWLAPDALIIWEDNAAPKIEAGFTQYDQRKYGGTILTFLGRGT